MTWVFLRIYVALSEPLKAGCFGYIWWTSSIHMMRLIIIYLPVYRCCINDSYYIDCTCVEHGPYDAECNIDCKKHSRWSKVTSMLVCTCAQQNYVLQDLCSCISLKATKPKTIDNPNYISSSWLWMCTKSGSFLSVWRTKFILHVMFLVTNLLNFLIVCLHVLLLTHISFRHVDSTRHYKVVILLSCWEFCTCVPIPAIRPITPSHAQIQDANGPHLGPAKWAAQK